MGPFRWNDLIQLWENVNNGMVMNNVSFQDMFMMGYDVDSGDNAGGLNVSLSPSNWGTLNDCDGQATTVFWSTDSNGDTNIANAKTVTFNISGGSILISIEISQVIGVGLTTIKYSKNSGAAQTYTTPFTVTNGDTLKIGLESPSGDYTLEGQIIVTDTTRNVILDEISYTTFNEEYTLTPSDWGNLNGGSPGVLWASTSGPQSVVTNGNNVQFTLLSIPVTITLTTSDVTGVAPTGIRYTLNNNTPTNYISSLNITNTSTLRVGLSFPSATGNGGGNLIITDTTNNRIIDTIPYTFEN